MIENLTDEMEWANEASFEDDAAKQREESFNAVYEWQDRALEPYSMLREDLVTAFTAGDLDGAALGPTKTLAELRPWASALLFACSHSDPELIALRKQGSAYRERILKWMEQNITRQNADDAVRLALKINNEAYAHLATPKPADRSSSSGN